MRGEGEGEMAFLDKPFQQIITNAYEQSSIIITYSK